MKTLFYYIIKIIIKTGLFFYNKKTVVVGRKNIPENEAVLFLANHPNGLIDPLIIASNITRKTHFLVRADVFKHPFFAKLFDSLGMMPVYRIRNGYRQLKKNNAIFKNCEKLLSQKKALLIFPEGSHSRQRTVRPLSNGFTRIVFGAIEKHPTLKIYIVPVGLTYQNSSKYPSKVALHFGKPIEANRFFNASEIPFSVKNLKNEVAKQLQMLSVHITNNQKYQTTLTSLNNAQVDFTDVSNINHLIETNCIPTKKAKKKNYFLPLKWLIILNSFIPYSIWKVIHKKTDEIEFIDTFRFGFNVVLFTTFYCFQSIIISNLYCWEIGVVYFFSSVFLIMLYTKLTIITTETHIPKKGK